MRGVQSTFFTLICLLGFYAINVDADVSRLRIVGLTGLSQADITGANTTKKDLQGPLGISAHVDYLLSGQWEVGAEHLRTLSDRNGSAVGFTGISLKNYFWFSHPQTEISDEDSRSRAIFRMQALIPYIGISTGIAQASILDRNIGALGGYFAVKGGWEYSMSGGWGLRIEGNLAGSIFGSGSVNFFSFLGGVYFYL